MNRTRGERGAVAIEFALIFGLLFGMFWAIISYALPFFTQQVMNHAVAEAARFAVRAELITDRVSYEARLRTLANQQLTTSLAVLPPGFRAHLQREVQMQVVNGQRVLEVRLVYPNYNLQPIVPVMRLPGLGPIPNLPGNLTASARYQLAPL